MTTLGAYTNGGLVTWVHEIKSFVIAKKDLTRKLDPRVLSKGSLNPLQEEEGLIYTFEDANTTIVKIERHRTSTGREVYKVDALSFAGWTIPLYETSRDHRRVFWLEDTFDLTKEPTLLYPDIPHTYNSTTPTTTFVEEIKEFGYIEKIFRGTPSSFDVEKGVALIPFFHKEPHKGVVVMRNLPPPLRQKLIWLYNVLDDVPVLSSALPTLDLKRDQVYTVSHYTTSFDKFWSANLEDIYLDLFEKSAKKVSYEKNKDKRRVLFYEEVVKAVSTIRPVGKGLLDTTNLDTLL